MQDHYYSRTPDAAHDYHEWTFALFDRPLSFLTDAGVFSKGRVDFGSVTLLKAFTSEKLPEGVILDVGCGYGPIGLFLAAKTGRPLEMIDINERAVELAQKNARKNNLENVDIHTSDLFTDLHHEKYAAIVSNPPIRAGKKVVHAILEKAVEHLLPGGTLTIVIQKKQGAPSAKKKMEEVFGNAAVLKKDKGYYVLQSIKK